ncbi:hypothetical protein [Amycolatopsis sp. NPDC059021]|uniref:hypothetical protein n=1 Tax=Amycolatopsis sp. NPDC059021 TaxID=3346704 RepID=UPI00367198FE
MATQLTQVSFADIQQRANDHREKASLISGYAGQAVNAAENALQGSKSGMTQAIMKMSEEWRGMVQRVVGDLNDMADVLDGANKDAQHMDQDNTQAANNAANQISQVSASGSGFGDYLG